MRQVIYVATTPGRVDFIKNFLDSMKDYDGKYPIFIESWYQYDWYDFAKHHQYDEILFLHDSVEMKDLSFFDLVFDTYRGKSVSITGAPYFLMGLGKFLREPYLAAAESFPKTSNAYMDYAPIEYQFGKKYCELTGETPIVIDPHFMDCEIKGNRKTRKFDKKKFGRQNLILENKYMRKYKGHWSREMCEAADKNGFIQI